MIKECNEKRRDYFHLWNSRGKLMFPQVAKVLSGGGIPIIGKRCWFQGDFWELWPSKISGAVSSIQNQNTTFLRALHLFWKTVFL